MQKSRFSQAEKHAKILILRVSVLLILLIDFQADVSIDFEQFKPCFLY